MWEGQGEVKEGGTRRGEGSRDRDGEVWEGRRGRWSDDGERER